MNRLDYLKMAFGFALLVILGILAAIIGLGRVEEKYSFGLPFILGSLSTLSGGFAGWAFGTAITKEQR